MSMSPLLGSGVKRLHPRSTLLPYALSSTGTKEFPQIAVGAGFGTRRLDSYSVMR